jgi:hypothetical protein
LASPDSAIVCDCGHPFDVVAAAKAESIAFAPARDQHQALGGAAKVLVAIGGGLLGALAVGAIRSMFEGPWATFLEHASPQASVAGGVLALQLAKRVTARPRGDVAPPKHGYLVRHWRGELPLATTYWVNGVLASILGAALVKEITALVAGLGGLDGKYAALVLLGTMWLVTSIIYVWQLVGVWRSSGRRESAWGTPARVVLVLAGLNMIRLFGAVGLPGLTAAVRQARWMDENGRWSIRALNGGKELEVWGGISGGLTADLSRAIQANPGVDVVHLNLGAGGSIREARRLRELLRASSLSTYVSASCNSACTVAFLGGRQRFLKAGARLGFHRVSAPGVVGRAAAEMWKAERDYLVAAGVSGDFADHVMRTPEDTLWYPKPDELVAAGVVTELTDGGRFAFTVGGKAPTLAETRTLLEKTRLYQAIKAFDPPAYGRITQQVQTTVAAGGPLEDARKLIVPIIRAVGAKASATASDEAVDRLGEVMLAGVAQMQSALADDCFAYVTAGPRSAAVAAQLPHDLQTSEQERLADLIASARPGSPRPISPSELSKLHARALQLGSRTVGSEVLALARSDLSALQPRVACTAAYGLRMGVSKLPREDRIKVLRAELSEAARQFAASSASGAASK